MKKALIAGVAGQDGSYLAELLKEKGYEVTGVDRSNGNLLERDFTFSLVERGFDEIYNLASISDLSKPWDDPAAVIASTALIPVQFLNAIRLAAPQTRFFQASSAEMYGDPVESPQRESTPFNPRGPYGWGKLLAHQLVENFRSTHGLFTVSGILFNHESPRRPAFFVTRKITSTLARIARGAEDVLELGNLDSMRDWSFAGDVVRGMWLSLQAKQPNTYVFASGTSHTVREFVEAAARALGITLRWEGSGTEEKGYDEKGRLLVRVNPEFYRPKERNPWRGDIAKIKKELNWEPQVSFEELVAMMVKAEE